VKDIVPYRSLKVSLNHATVMAIEVNAGTGWEALTAHLLPGIFCTKLA